jgi:hypothetical protein
MGFVSLTCRPVWISVCASVPVMHMGVFHRSFSLYWVKQVRRSFSSLPLVDFHSAALKLIRFSLHFSFCLLNRAPLPSLYSWLGEIVEIVPSIHAGAACSRE